MKTTRRYWLFPALIVGLLNGFWAHSISTVSNRYSTIAPWHFSRSRHRSTTLHSKVCYSSNARRRQKTDRQPKAAFEDFLTNYKSTATSSDQLAADALQDLNLEEDGLSDEYDFMDDVENGKESRSTGQFPAPKRKYMDMLQKVVDRQTNEVIVELDDLDNVRSSRE